jgi:hypothetical protein
VVSPSELVTSVTYRDLDNLPPASDSNRANTCPQPRCASSGIGKKSEAAPGA